MARFELHVSLVSRDDAHEVEVQDTEFMCFCKDTSDTMDMIEKAHEIVNEELEGLEDEFLFGTADIVVGKETMVMLQFKNNDVDSEDLNEIIDMIIGDPDDSHTIH